MRKLFLKIVLLALSATILLPGCSSVDYYTDTPGNIISGKSEIKRNGEYLLESIIFKSGVTKYFSGYYTVFTGCSKDSCTNLVFRNTGRVCDTIPKTDTTPMRLRYIDPTTDSVKVSDIQLMTFRREKFDSGSFAFVAGVILFLPLLYVLIHLVSGPAGG